MSKKMLLPVIFIIAIIVLGGALFLFFKGGKINTNFEVSKYLSQIDKSKFNEARSNLYSDVSSRLAKNPQDWEAMRDLANIYAWQDNYSQAEEILTQVLKYQPEDVIALQNMAQIYHNQKRYSLAEETYYQILKINSLWMPAYESLGELYRFKLVEDNEKYPQTINAAREADYQDQYEQSLLRRLAFYYAYAQKREKALETFAEFTTKFPKEKDMNQVYEDLKAGKVID